MQWNSFNSFEEFWPYYVSEHSKPITRFWHFVGTTGLWVVLILMIWTRWWSLIILAPVVAYGFAWLGHFVFERNRPATFSYPLWSLRGDFRMYRLMLTGQMKDEIAQVQKRSRAGLVER